MNLIEKEYDDLKLLYYEESLVLSTSATEVKQQVIDNYGENTLNIMMNKPYEDEYDMRRYALYLSSDDKHLILLTTGCYKEDYDKNHDNLPKIEQLADNISETCEDIDNYFPINVFDSGIVFGYKWYGQDPEYTLIEDEQLYKQLLEDNYHNVIAYIEERV